MITDTFAISLLNYLGAPLTNDNVNFLRAWSRKEGTAAKNNPLATTWDMRSKGATLFNSTGVQNYPDEITGVQATGNTIKQANMKPILNLLLFGTRHDENLSQDTAKSFKLWSGSDSYQNALKTLFKEQKTATVVIPQKGKDIAATGKKSNNTTLLILFSVVVLSGIIYGAYKFYL